MKALRALAFVLASIGCVCTCGGVALLIEVVPGAIMFSLGVFLLIVGTAIGVWTEE